MSGAEFEGYEALVSELRADPPVAPERLRERVLEGAPAPRRRRSRRQRLLFVVVPVAAVLAVGAALVHGFVSSNSQTRKAATQAALAPRPALRAPVHKALKTTLRQSPTFSTSKSQNASGSLEAAAGDSLQKLGTTGAGTAYRSVVIPKNRLVHATASLQVQVKDHAALTNATNKASQIVGALGGYAQSVHYEASSQGYGSSVLALRVPVQKAQTALANLAKLGNVLSQQVSTQDLQAKLTHQTNAIGSLQRAIAVYVQALKSPTLPESQRVAIQIRLNNARHALAVLRHARTGTLASGATADIALLLTTRNHAVVPAHHGNSRIGRLLGSAAHFLALEGIIVLYALIVLAPVLLLGGLAWWILRERRRREERLLASA